MTNELDHIEQGAQLQVDRKKRPPLQIKFNEPFSLPEVLNLDPDNTDYIQSCLAPGSDDGVVVDIVDFTVEGSHVTGDVEILHIDTVLESRQISVFRKGPTGPYAFDMNLTGLSYHDIGDDVPLGEIFDGSKRFLSHLEADQMDDATGIWDAFSQSWQEQATGEFGVPLFNATDVPDLRFTVYNQPIGTPSTKQNIQ